MFNILEKGTSRQARNVSAQALVETVSPWFSDVAGDGKVRQALKALSDESSRTEALKFLGLRLEEVTPRAMAA